MNEEEYKRSTAARMMKFRHVTESGCWNWTGSVAKNGYARVGYHGKSKSASRIAAYIWLGLDMGDKWKFVCHKCDNPLCFNPDHLFIGSPKDNFEDCLAKGRFTMWEKNKKTHCKRGHEFTAVNTIWKVSRGKPTRRCAVCRKEERRVWDLAHKNTPPASRRSHCSKGHEFTQENTRIHNGTMQCRECIRARKRSAYKKVEVSRRGLKGVRRGLTHCPHGHEYTPENTKMSYTGCKTCRTCINAGRRRLRLRKKVIAQQAEV